jgi:hypothetical protein
MKNLVASDGLMNHVFALPDVGDRFAFYVGYLKDKKTLHIGCSGHPRKDPVNNLHIRLIQALGPVDGLDISREGLDWLASVQPGRYFLGYDQVTEPYDVLLVPEVMEHVLNPGLFLRQLFSLNAERILITVPNAITIMLANKEKFGPATIQGQPVYVETTHRGHAAYYSPVTLGNLVESSIAEYAPGKWELEQLFLSQLSVGCIVARCPHQVFSNKSDNKS